jgi:hypothetical protein
MKTVVDGYLMGDSPERRCSSRDPVAMRSTAFESYLTGT